MSTFKGRQRPFYKYVYNLTNYLMCKTNNSKNLSAFLRKWQGGVLLGAVALLMTACAADGYDDDERYTSNVTGSSLTSPKVESIKVSPSADGKSQTITWDVVKGAEGYLFSFYDMGNPDEPIVKDSLIDGCTVTVKREEDMNYRIDLRTAGNAKLNNAEAPETTQYTFSTFTATYKTIPAGSDLNEWFAANPLPADSIGVNLNYDLEAGGQYTLSGTLDFNVNAVTLRSTSKVNHATINFTGEATINFAAPFNMKYVDVDCTAQEISSTNHGIFAFSKDPSAAPIGTEIDAKYKWEKPMIEKPVTFVNSNFKNVRSYFFWDHQQTVCIMTMLIDNCVVQLAPEKDFAGGVFWTNKGSDNNGSHINELYITNSTFYELPDCEHDYKYFYQAGMKRGEDIYADKNVATNTVSYTNSTFYHVTWNGGQWGNYNGMGGRSYAIWVMTDCIFVDCSPSGVPRRFLHGKKNQSHVTFNNNTYMKADGTFHDIQSDGSHEYDLSGTVIEEDPQFANPAIGDFHISGATQIARKTGDPRWLP